MTPCLRPVVLACLAAVVRLAAVDMDPVYLGTPFLYGWVPDEVRTLRGAIVLDGWPLDGRWNEAARFWGYAVLRINTDGYEEQLAEDSPLAANRLARAKAVAHGLERLGELTGHPELVNVPLVTSGYSRFSGPAHAYVEQFPGRVLCFLTGFGISGTEATPELERQRLLWLETPSQWLGCEWENIYSGGDKSTILDPQWHRPPGVLRMASMTWRVYHNPGNYSDLGFVFVDRCIAARVPADWDPHAGPPELKPVRLEDGWLGSHEKWAIPVEQIPATNNENARIAPYAEFAGDRTLASWILDEEVAWVWRAMNSRHPKATVIAPSHPGVAVHEGKNIPPVLHAELGLRAGEPFAVTVRGDADDLSGIELFANTTPLGAGSRFTGGEAPFGSTRNATCEVEVTVPEPGVYGLMARYTTRGGEIGWTNPAPIIVWPRREQPGAD